MDTLLNDIRFALRMWLRNPGFAGIAVLTLALGIGANTLMFSVVNATLLKPLSFPEPARLMTVWKGSVKEADNLNIVSWPNYRDYVKAGAFESLGLLDSAGKGYNLTGGGDGEQVSGVRVTASFFSVLGVAPAMGRTFLESEEAPGHQVVVLSHGLWTRRYAADPAIVGRTIQIDSLPYTVVGVMPASFQFQFGGGVRQLWVPAAWTAGDEDRGSNSFIAIGRLKRGVTLERARSEMDTIGRRLADAYPEQNAGSTVRLVPMNEYGVRGLRPTLLTLLGVVGFVLLIACVNVANLMLARAAVRSRELAVRTALGAGRARLLRQLLTESVLLSLAGAVGGITLAYWGTSAVQAILPNNLRFLPLRPVDRIAIDGMVLLFTSVLAVGCGVLFGLAPALTALRTDLAGPLKESGRGATSGKSRLRYALVSSEVALTLMVLAGAGVMLVSVARLLGVNPGLDPRNVLVMFMSLPQENFYYGPPGNPRFCSALAREVGAVPGVRSASAIAHLPLSGGNAGRGLVFEGRPDADPENRVGAGYSVACPGLLTTLGMKLASGRDFTDQDAFESPHVALVNEAMARRDWPNEDAVGKRFKIRRGEGDEPWITVVGVMRNNHHSGLDAEPRPWFIRPYQQAGWPFMSLVVKTQGAPASYAAQVKAAIARVEPGRPVSNVRTMEEVVGGSVSSRRFPMLLLSGFALLALVLAAVGIAGVVGYSVVQRTPEIGVRLALGAQRGDVLRLILGHALAWTLGGVAAGLAGSLLVLRLLGTLLYGVTASDPLVLGSVSLVLIVIALAASYMPARRAIRVDAVTALRQ